MNTTGTQAAGTTTATDTRNDEVNSWTSGPYVKVVIGALLAVLFVVLWRAFPDMGLFARLLIGGAGLWAGFRLRSAQKDGNDQVKAVLWIWPYALLAMFGLWLLLAVTLSYPFQAIRTSFDSLTKSDACTIDETSQACVEKRSTEAAELTRQRQAEIERAAHIAAVKAASIVQAMPSQGLERVTLTKCSDEPNSESDDSHWSEDIVFTPGWKFKLGYSSDVLRYRHLPEDSPDWQLGKPAAGAAIALGVCATNRYIVDKQMSVSWVRK